MIKESDSKKLIMFQYGDKFSECTRIVNNPISKLAHDEVLIKNIYAGVNGVYDLNMVRNAVSYIKYKPPTDLGIESVGIIEEIGKEVHNLAVGDSVSTWKVGEGYKHYQTAKSSRVIKIPEVSPKILSLFPTGISALVGMEQVAGLKSNQIIAISAAAGGLGHLLVQFAKKAGNHVIGICGSDKKVEVLKNLKCDRIINYQKEDVNHILNSEYPKGINIGYDSVGGSIFDSFLDNLACRGRLVISGYTSEVGKPWENITSPRIYSKLYFRSASVRGFINPHFEEFHQEATRRLISMYNNEELQILVDPKKFNGLDSIPKAVDYLLEGKNIGKVVVELQRP